MVHPNVAECGNVGSPIERVAIRRAPIVFVASPGPCAYDLDELLRIFIRQRAKKHRSHGAENCRGYAEAGS
jgi:hypothetical protein